MRRAVVVTSIASPNAILRQIANDCLQQQIPFYLIGDSKSPSDFALEGCDFYSVDRQLQVGLQSASLVPLRHYARKNLGYLLAIRNGANVIIETDDDNMPRSAFYEPLARNQIVPEFTDAGWLNVYRYYSDLLIWPRGLPLDEVTKAVPELAQQGEVVCPIQQGLADDNPDVDAVYRLLLPLDITFRTDLRVALNKNSWCPFNSQNTAFYAEAFPLLYLPAYCSFRMTDIWRSFVAQRIAWENGWSILFREATVAQLRNDHRLMKDFEDEIPGYLNNSAIRGRLEALPLRSGQQHISDNLRACYEALVDMGVVGREELPLLEAWILDLQQCSATSASVA